MALTIKQSQEAKSQQLEIAKYLDNFEGNTESEDYLSAIKDFEDLDVILSDSPQQQSMEPLSSAPEYNPLGLTDEQYRNTAGALQTADDFTTGVGQGLKNAIQFGEDLGRRGIDSIFGTDTLTSLNNRRSEQFIDTYDARTRSPTGFGAGETTGELAATLPVGGIGGIGGKAVGTHLGTQFIKRPAVLGVDASQAAIERAALIAADKTAKAKLLVGGTQLAGEGAAIGGYSTYGGAEDRLLGATQGAITDLVGGSVVNKVTQTVGAARRSRATVDETTLMDADTRYRRPGSGVTDPEAPRGDWPTRPVDQPELEGDYSRSDIDTGIAASRTNQMDRIAEAREFGGIDIDSFVARGDYQSLRRLQEIMSDPELRVEYKNARAMQEKQKADFATQRVEEFGTVTPEKLAAPEQGLAEFQKIITAKRTDAEASYKASWQVYRDAAQDNNITPDLNPINTRLAELSDDLAPDTVQAANETYASQLTKQLKKYQLLGGKTSKVTTKSTTPERDGILPRLSTAKTEVVTDAGAGRPLTVDNYHDLISDINGSGNYAQMTPNEKALRRKVLIALDEGIDEAMRLGGADDAVIELGRKARREQASFNDQWTRDDIVDRLSSVKKKDDEVFRTDYSKALDNLNLSDVKKLHRAVGLDPNNPGWQTLVQVKLLKALKIGLASDREAAETLAVGLMDDIPGDGSNFSVDAFNYKGFFKEIESVDRTIRVELWGEEATSNFEKMHKVYSESVKRPSNSGSANTSGTALTLIDAGRYGGRGGMRDIFMGLHSAAPKLFMKANQGSRREALQASLAGEMDDISRKELEAAIAGELEKNFRSYTDFVPSDVVSTFIRRTFTTSVASDGNDEDSLKQ